MIFLYSIFCLFLAWNNANRISDGKRIYHGLNSLFHLVAAFVTLLIWGWADALSLLLLTRVVFDLALNAFRGFPLTYVSSKPKSWVDKIEAKIWGRDGLKPKILYLLILLCLQILK